MIYLKVQSAILDKLDTKFDWFTLDRDITLSNICLDQAVNLVSIFLKFVQLYK